jgi:hypothetical protein
VVEESAVLEVAVLAVPAVAVLAEVWVAGCASRTAKPKAANAVKVAAPIE